MTDQFEDETLRRRFGELRQQEESQHAPEFDDVLTRALARRRAPTHASRRIIAVAAAAVLALGLGWFASRPRGGAPPQPDSRGVAALSQWRSPTGFLLEGPSDSLLRTMPTITTMPPELRSVLRAGAHVQEKRS
jgi:hypothetical protein